MLLAPYHLLWKRLQKREIGGTVREPENHDLNRVVSRQGLTEIHSFASLWCRIHQVVNQNPEIYIWCSNEKCT